MSDDYEIIEKLSKKLCELHNDNVSLRANLQNTVDGACELHVEITRLRAREAALWEAIGLLTTLAPRMKIDTSDPMKMAKTIEATVRAALKEATP
jgi:regulator of replication initiation timing